MIKSGRLVPYSTRNSDLSNFYGIKQDITDNSRNLNRYPDAPMVGHLDGKLTSPNTVNQYPEWWHRSNKAKWTKGYYHPKPLKDSVYRNKAGPVMENSKFTNFQNWHKYRDTFYDSSSSKDELWKYRPGEMEGSDRVVPSLVAKNSQKPLGYKRSYLPTREEKTGEKMNDNWNITSGPRQRNIQILNIFHGKNRKGRTLPDDDGSKNNRLNTGQTTYSNYENLGMKGKDMTFSKDRNTIGDNWRNIVNPYAEMDRDRGKNQARNNPGVFEATRKGSGQGGSYIEGGLGRINIMDRNRDSGKGNSRLISNPDSNIIKKDHLRIQRLPFEVKVNAMQSPKGVLFPSKKAKDPSLKNQNTLVLENRYARRKAADEKIDDLRYPVL